MGIAVAVLGTELDSLVPGVRCCCGQCRLRAVGNIERHWHDAQALVALRLALGGETVVMHHLQHGTAVVGIVRKGAELARHLGRGAIGGARHQRRDGGAQRSALVAVIAEA